jgi:radical SAM superfamily enzyme YgiQ (UPF0313 family)
MRVLLIHVRDPQFFAYPAARRSQRGVPQVIGFPPIGIMSLSAVLKRAGHECLMFDQANPETPNEVILDEIARWQPDLVGLSFLSTTSYPYAKILVRQIRAANAEVRIAFGGVFVTLNPLQVKGQCPEVDFICRGEGEQLILDLLDNLDDPRPVLGLTWTGADGELHHNAYRSTSRPFCPSPATRPCRPRAVARGRVSSATFPRSARASGVPGARSTCWRSSSSWRRMATVACSSSTIISCSSPSGSRPSARGSSSVG